MRNTLSLAAVSIAALVALAVVQRSTAADPLATAGAGAPMGNVANIDRCQLQLNSIDGVAEVPAQEAGVLTKVNVREGQFVRAGTLLANIDDKQTLLQQKNAQAEYSGAKEKSDSMVDIEFATKAALVAEYEYKMDQKAADRVKSSITDVEMQKTKFQWDRALAGIDQANKQKVIDGFTAAAKKAEMDLAEEGLHRREIRAPIDGVVQEIKQHLGEWVKPGDTVIRVIRLDQLSVAGALKSDLYNPGDVIDQPVTVQVVLPGGRSVQVPGKIAFVASEVDLSGRFKVVAVIDNPKDKNQWVLRPGLPATMSIQLR